MTLITEELIKTQLQTTVQIKDLVKDPVFSRIKCFTIGPSCTKIANAEREIKVFIIILS